MFASNYHIITILYLIFYRAHTIIVSIIIVRIRQNQMFLVISDTNSEVVTLKQRAYPCSKSRCRWKYLLIRLPYHHASFFSPYYKSMYGQKQYIFKSGMCQVAERKTNRLKRKVLRMLRGLVFSYSVIFKLIPIMFFITVQ
jgi:hypothetical protein